MGGYTTRLKAAISSFPLSKKLSIGGRLNGINAGSSAFPGRAALVAGTVAGLAALTVPWLVVNGSIETGGYSPPSPDDQKSGVSGPANPRPLLLVLPEAAPPAPKLASSAPSLSAPAPDAGSVLTLKTRLRSLSYMVGPDGGTLDPATRFGITAFQKVENLPRTGEPDPITLSRLDSAQAPAPQYSTPPDHLEVDIRRQVVFVVRGGRVTQTLPTSTGTGKMFRSEGRRSRAVTPSGQFAITYKRNGWRRSPLGLLYRPSYFNGGIAFHGAKSVPTSPASHGCVRLPMAFADWFADNAAPVGMVVYVFGNEGQPDPAAVMSAAPVPAPPPPPDDVAGLPPEAPQPPDQPSSGPAPGFLGGILPG